MTGSRPFIAACGVLYMQTNTEFLSEYYHRTANKTGNKTGLTGHQEAPYGYDSVWTVALMLNNSIQRMTDEGRFHPFLHQYGTNLIHD